MRKPITKKNGMFLISELAAQLEMSPHTIRFYEEKGLISPQRTAGNQRVYTTKDRARLKLILRGKRFGFTLDEIAEMIGMADTELNEIAQIEKSIAYGQEKLKEIQKRREELELLEKDIMALHDSLVRRRDMLLQKK